MGKIKKILENELVGGTQSTDVYPVTSTKAVYDTGNKVLDDYIQHLKKTSTFAGIATPTTNPGTPDGNVFYLAGEGTYVNFSNLVIESGQLGILKWDGTWSKQTIKVGLPANELLEQSVYSAFGNIDNSDNLIYVEDVNLGSSSILTGDYYILAEEDFTITELTVYPVGTAVSLEVNGNTYMFNNLIANSINKIPFFATLKAGEKLIIKGESLYFKTSSDGYLFKKTDGSYNFTGFVSARFAIVKKKGFLSEEALKENLKPYDEQINNLNVILGNYIKTVEYAKNDSSLTLTGTVVNEYFGYTLPFISDLIVIKKIHVKPASTQLRLFANDTEYVFNNLTKDKVTEIDCNILVTNSLVYFRDVYFNLNSTFEFVNKTGSKKFNGLLGVWFEYDCYDIANKDEVISEINNIYNFPLGQKGAVYKAKYWDNNEDFSDICNGGCTKVETGLQLSTTATNFKNSALSIQNNTLLLNASIGSKFTIQVGQGTQYYLQAIIDFSTNKITDSLGGSTNFPEGFIDESDIDSIDLSVNISLENEINTFILVNSSSSQRFEHIVRKNNLQARQISIKVNTGSIILKKYELDYPMDLDGIFVGDSITQGVGGENETYALLYRDYTDKKIATYAVGGGKLTGTGKEAVNICCILKPKFISAMFGMNDGNTVEGFRYMQDKCDEYKIPFFVQHIPTATSTGDRTERNNAVVEEFIRDYAHIKQSARFDIATKGESDLHTDKQGHKRMFNRFFIDVPMILN